MYNNNDDNDEKLTDCINKIDIYTTKESNLFYCSIITQNVVK